MRELDKMTTDHKIQLASSIILMLAGIILLFSGFWVNPTGVIHPSVLTAFGEALTFVGAIWGIDFHYKYKSHTNKEQENS